MVSPSAEIRWFQHESLSLDVLTWFLEGSAGDRSARQFEPEERTDRYLRLPGVETVGIKVRAYGDQHHLEIKALRGAAETVTLPNGVSGKLEHWVKWSYGEETVKPLVGSLLAEHSGYVDVEKSRWQRQFMVRDGKPTEVPREPVSEHGCYAELVRVRVNEDEWWSFAFEAAGEPDEARAAVLAVVSHFLTEHRPRHAFTAINSASYPTWLAAVRG